MPTARLLPLELQAWVAAGALAISAAPSLAAPVEAAASGGGEEVSDEELEQLANEVEKEVGPHPDDADPEAVDLPVEEDDPLPDPSAPVEADEPEPVVPEPVEPVPEVPVLVEPAPVPSPAPVPPPAAPAPPPPVPVPPPAADTPPAAPVAPPAPLIAPVPRPAPDARPSDQRVVPKAPAAAPIAQSDTSAVEAVGEPAPPPSVQAPVESDLAAPRETRSDAAVPLQGSSSVYVVEAGDSLWSIADERLGGDAAPARVAREVERLWDLNADRIRTGSPDLISPGDRLLLPS